MRYVICSYKENDTLALLSWMTTCAERCGTEKKYFY